MSTTLTPGQYWVHHEAAGYHCLGFRVDEARLVNWVYSRFDRPPATKNTEIVYLPLYHVDTERHLALCDLISVALHPTPPPCAEGHTHEWGSPPGITLTFPGASTYRQHTCRHCGARRIVDTHRDRTLVPPDEPYIHICYRDPVDPATLQGGYDVHLVNLTPHTVILELDGEHIEIPPSGKVARVALHVQSEYVVRYDGVRIPVSAVRPGLINGLPDPRDGVCYIVSQLVAQVAPHRTDLLVPDTDKALRDKHGRIVAVPGLLSYAESQDT